MIATLSRKIALYLQQNDNEKKMSLEVYIYGIELVLYTFISLLVLFVIGWILNVIVEIIIYTMAFGILRISAGGYHASSHVKCFIQYTLAAMVVILLSNILIFTTMQYTFVLSILCIISAILILAYAPVDTPNKPLSLKEVDIYKRKSRVYILLFSIGVIYATAFYPSMQQYILIASGAVLIESLTLLPIFNRKEEDLHEKVLEKL